MVFRFSLWLSLFLMLFSGGSGAENAPPQRIVSMNLCVDQLLILLAEPQQIAALTQLAHDPDASYYYQQALAYPTNKGLAEEVLPFKPDLVIAGEYAHVATVQLLKKLGIPVETLPIPNSLNEVFNNIRRIGDLVGQSERAIAIIQQMQQRLPQASASVSKAPLVAVYEANGYTVGDASLRGEILHQAGWQNAATQLGINSYGQIALEDLIRLRPLALIDSPYRAGTYSRAQALLAHRALKSSAFSPHIIQIPSKLTICEGPWLIDVIEQLQAERLKLPVGTMP